jgi:hypothetical protein
VAVCAPGCDSGPLPDGFLRLTGFRQAWQLPPNWPDRMPAPGQVPRRGPMTAGPVVAGVAVAGAGGRMPGHPGRLPANRAAGSVGYRDADALQGPGLGKIVAHD